MTAIDVGRVCVLIMGRRAGEEVVVTKVIDDNFVTVKTKKGKERKASIRHLEPTNKKE